MTEMSKVALSAGWSLLGYHHQAIFGSPSASAPSARLSHGVLIPGVVTEPGVPV
ncbi:hypothetical protein [Nonomuraea sp. NPDC052265]|uniref:hypothetical protein n=1 Tax=Nonomuraea sp. NPDC052265 TaxID=3364374 RepID=UPI0037CB9C55